MSDKETIAFLRSHGLERLVEIFAREEIRLADLPFLQAHPTDLQQLIPRLRDRIDLQQAMVQSSTKSTQADMDPPILCRETLIEICARTDVGRMFLDSYKIENGKHIYPPESRTYLKKAMVENFFKNTKGRITHNHFMEMVQTIIKELPDEDPRTWYIPSVQGKSAGGLLYNRYRYMQHTDPRFKKAKHDDAQPGPSNRLQNLLTWDNMDDCERGVCEAAKNKLKITGYSDSETIMSCWKESFPLRRKEALDGKIVFKDWDIIMHYENVHGLINYDFQQVHSAINDIMTNHASKFVQNFRKIIHGYRDFLLEDTSLLDAIVNNFVGDVHVNDKTIFLSFYALPLILRQQFTAKEKKRAKVSIFACRAAFIQLIESEARIMEVVAKHRQEARQTKTTIQPYIIVVGSVEQSRSFFVILDELVFKLKSMLAAIDLHFKLFTVFYLEYPKECENVLQFIQDFFYNISYPGDRFDSCVTALISDCKRL